MTNNVQRTLSVLVLAALLFTTGCASGPPFERVSRIPGDRAVIYIFRESTGLGALGQMGIKMNTAPVASLWANEYVAVPVRPGRVLITSWGVRSLDNGLDKGGLYGWLTLPVGPSMSLEVAAGREYFVEIRAGWELKHHSTESPPKELLSTKLTVYARPWASESDAYAARGCTGADCQSLRERQPQP